MLLIVLKRPCILHTCPNHEGTNGIHLCYLGGVVSGEDNPRLETYAMKVVYLNGCNLGLAFL